MFERLDLESLEVILFAAKQEFSEQPCPIGTELILLGLIAQENFSRNQVSSSLSFFETRNITLETAKASIFSVLGTVLKNIAETASITSDPQPQAIELGSNYRTVSFTFTDERSFSERALRSLRQAEIEADQNGECSINPTYLLLGLIKEGQELIENQPNNALLVLDNLGINIQDLRIQIEQTLAKKN